MELNINPGMVVGAILGANAANACANIHASISSLLSKQGTTVTTSPSVYLVSSTVLIPLVSYLVGEAYTEVHDYITAEAQSSQGIDKVVESGVGTVIVDAH